MVIKYYLEKHVAVISKAKASIQGDYEHMSFCCCTFHKTIHHDTFNYAFFLWNFYLTAYTKYPGLLLVLMFYSEGYPTFKQASRTRIRQGTPGIVI